MHILILFLCCTVAMIEGMEQGQSLEPCDRPLLVFNREFLQQLTDHRNKTPFITNENFLPDEDLLTCFQQGLYRLQKEYDNQSKARLSMTELQTTRLKRYAQLQLAAKKKENEAQYMTVGEFHERFGTKNQNTVPPLCRYKSIRCSFKKSSEFKEDNGTIRYFVQDHIGNNSVYANCFKLDQLPKKVREVILRQHEELATKGGHIVLEQKKNKRKEYTYYVTTKGSIETYCDRVCTWESCDILALCKPFTFISALQQAISSMAYHLKKGAKEEKTIEERTYQLKDLTKTAKDQTMLMNLLKEHGPEYFYEKMINRTTLETQMTAIDQAVERGSFIAVDDKYEESYGIKQGDTYYLFGVKLDPDDSDALIVASIGGRRYGFADELAKIKKERD